MKLFIVAALLTLAVAEPPSNYGAPRLGSPLGSGIPSGPSGPAYGVPSQFGGGPIQNGPVEIDGDEGYEQNGNYGQNIPNDIVSNDILARVIEAINANLAQQDAAQAAAYGVPGAQQGAPIGSNSLNGQYGAPAIGGGSLNGQYGAPGRSLNLNSQYGAPLGGPQGSGPITLIGGPIPSRVIARLRQSGIQAIAIPSSQGGNGGYAGGPAFNDRPSSVSSNYGAPGAGIGAGSSSLAYGPPPSLNQQSYNAPVALPQQQSYNAPVALPQQQSYNAPIALPQQQSYNAPIALAQQQSYGAPIALSQQQSYNAPIALSQQQQSYNAPIALSQQQQSYNAPIAVSQLQQSYGAPGVGSYH